MPLGDLLPTSSDRTVNEEVAGRIRDDAASSVEETNFGVEIDEVAVVVRVLRPVTVVIDQ